MTRPRFTRRIACANCRWRRGAWCGYGEQARWIDGEPAPEWCARKAVGL